MSGNSEIHVLSQKHAKSLHLSVANDWSVLTSCERGWRSCFSRNLYKWIRMIKSQIQTRQTEIDGLMGDWRLLTAPLAKAVDIARVNGFAGLRDDLHISHPVHFNRHWEENLKLYIHHHSSRWLVDRVLVYWIRSESFCNAVAALPSRSYLPLLLCG